MEDIYDVVIIGSGPAGLTAAIYAGRAELKTLVIAGVKYGGQLMDTTVIENYPGFPEGIKGSELIEKMIAQAQKFNAQIVFEDALKVELQEKIKKVYTFEKEYQAKTVILALGANPRKLNVTGEEKLWGKGVSACAVCDGALFKNKEVAVVGGGDSAMEEASFLTNFASKVYLIHRRDSFRAAVSMQKKVLNNPKIEILYNSEIEEIIGEEKIEALKIKNNQNQSSKLLKVDGLFLAIGHIPNTQILQGQLELDEDGYITTKNDVETSIAGVFASGDIKDKAYKQIVTATSGGAIAALKADKYLKEN
ncbi:MAG TPA: thioredoxin-disulfide reductase [Candidatus Paceibacterota bacterium]|nr:thioredoxin-disulfide reductase [Candidatus Paceibacterota bacterium]